MSELNCVEALDSVRVRFRVLRQASPGDIVVLDASGRWLLQPETSWGSWRSAFRKVWSLLSVAPVESQRQSFLKSAKESVKVLIHHCRLLMTSQLFNRSCDETGVLSLKSMRSLNANDVSDLEVLLQNIRSLCTDLNEGIGGLNNVLKHQPYADDLTFCSETQVALCDPVKHFLEQTYRKLGPFASKLLPALHTSAASTVSTLSSVTNPTGPTALAPLLLNHTADTKDDVTLTRPSSTSNLAASVTNSAAATPSAASSMKRTK